MGRTAADDRQQQLETLRPNHRAMARAILAGATPGNLATRWGMDPSSITRIINSPLFKAELARLEDRLEDATMDTVKAELESLRPRAVEIVAEELFNEAPSKRRTKTAFDLLDRTDFYPRRPSEGDADDKSLLVLFAPMPGEDPEAAKKRLEGFRQIATRQVQDNVAEGEFEIIVDEEDSDD